MGKLKDLLILFTELGKNSYVESDEEYEEVQAELSELLQANGESESRIAALEKSLDTAKRREELQKELKAPANAKEAVEKAKRRSGKSQDKEEKERE